MLVELRTQPFDPYAEMKAYADSLEHKNSAGAAACFIGSMRDFNEGEPVESLWLEYYPGMTEQHLQAICQEAAQQWQVQDCLLLHRVGGITVGEAIVLIGVWSAHRGDALDACKFIIEDLKARAPFWKKEKTRKGERWVEKNTSGYAG